MLLFCNVVQGHDGPVMAMACHASGGLMLATDGADKNMCMWDVDCGFCTQYLEVIHVFPFWFK